MSPARHALRDPQGTPGSRSHRGPSSGLARLAFAEGWSLGLPIFLGYVPVGVAFGILAGTLGFSVAAGRALLGNGLAGAGQFIALEFLRDGSTAVAVLAASTVVNLRYVLFASTMSTIPARTSPLGTQAVLAFSLTDETFAVNIADHRQGLATPASMAGVGRSRLGGMGSRHADRRARRGLDRRPQRVGSRLRDARDVHRAPSRPRRGLTPRDCRMRSRNAHARAGCTAVHRSSSSTPTGTC